MYLGIDQSLRSSGVVTVGSNNALGHRGTIDPKKLVGAPRLAFIWNTLGDLVAQSSPGIAYAALEGYSIESTNRAFDLGELGGVVRLLLYDAQIPFVIVAPRALKLFVAGTGDASKEMMREAVLKKWGMDFAQNDECDAYGLAQVAKSVHTNKYTTRDELEVITKLRNTDKKISLVASGRGARNV